MTDTMQSTPPTATVTEHTLVLRSMPSSVPVEIRMRRLLKAALRAYGFKLLDYYAKDVPTVAPKAARTPSG